MMEPRSKALLFFGVAFFTGLGVAVGAFLFSGDGVSGESRIAAAVSETFREVLGLRRERRPVLEIDLTEPDPEKEVDPRAEPAHTVNVAPKAAPGPKPAVRPEEEEAALAECEFGGGSASHYGVVFNEIAWMGTEANANDEWLELKNNSGGKADLSGWQLLSGDGRISFRFPDAALEPDGLFLLERTDDNSLPGIPADAVYTGLLPNSGSWLRLFDSSCSLADEIDASGGWNSFGGDRVLRKTLERNLGDLGWHTSSVAGGTPRSENSQPASVQQTMPSTSPLPAAPEFSPPVPSAAEKVSSCIDINSAPKSELVKITQIGDARAEQIVELRREQPFSSLDDLARVNGISAGGSRLNAIKREGLACVR